MGKCHLKQVIFDLNGFFVRSKFLSDHIKDDYEVESCEVISALKDIMPKVRVPNAPKVFPLWKPYFDKWGVSFTEKGFLDYWFSERCPKWNKKVY